LPIRWRLTLFNALFIGLILVALGLALFLLLRNAVLSEVEDSVSARAIAAARIVERKGELDKADAEQIALGEEFVVVRDGQGQILDAPWWLSAEHQEETENSLWAQALKTGQSVGDTADYSRDPPDYVYAVPVNPTDGPARVVEVGRSYEPATKTLETFAYILIGTILATIMLSVGGAYILAWAALSPFSAVVRSARQIGESDLSKRLPVRNPKDEIGGLATTINELLGRLEVALARRDEALARQEEALSRQRRFAADASHELRNPLTSIAGYARMLKAWGLKDPRTTQKGVTRILEQSARMGELVESLLALARGDDGGAPLELAPEDLGAVAAEAVEEARAAAGSKVAVEYTPPRDQVESSFDQAQIYRVAAILLDNAIKYTPEGGTVTVGVGEENGWVRFEVSDTGVGIAADELPLVFERFYRADPARTGGGAGLGLSIARQIAKAHGGEIEAKSEPGEGSTFVLRIPRSGSAR